MVCEEDAEGQGLDSLRVIPKAYVLALKLAGRTHVVSKVLGVVKQCMRGAGDEA